MDENEIRQAPEEGPDGIDRWTSNGYGLRIDGIEVIRPAEKEAGHGDETPQYSPDKRGPRSSGS